MEKITKRQMFEMILACAKENAMNIADYCDIEDVEITDEDVVEFCTNEIALLDKKAAKAKERAAEKRAAGDELYASVVATLTSTPATADAIFADNFADVEDLSVAKIRARLSQAVKNGVAVKETVKIDGKNKVVYTIAE